MVIFTDRSYIQETGGGAAIAFDKETRSKAFGPTNGVTNYEMELMALSLALNCYIDALETNTAPANNTLTVFSDSQEALQLLNDPLSMRTAQYLGKHLQELVQHISTTHTIKLHWTPGHHEIELNELADEAAGEAEMSEGEQFTLPFSFSCARMHVKQTYNTRGADINTDGYKTPGKAIAKAFDALEKGKAAAIFQLRSGHCPLNQFLARIQAVPNDRCGHCGRKETTTHFLLYCPEYTRAQRLFRDALKEAEIKLDTRRATVILDSPETYPYLADFIAFTNRFDHLRSYINN